MEEITVIVPIFNAEKTLRRCLDSIKQQDYRKYEVICVDDHSTDNSHSIAKEYGYNLIRLKENSGPGKTRNIGAKEAKTKLIAFTDSDCILPGDWLSKIIKNFENKKVKFICGGYSGVEGKSFLEKFAFYELLIRRRNLPRFASSFPSNNFACYRDIFLKEKGFPELKNYVAEDLEFSLKVGINYKIFWDKTLGVKHHFHKKIKKYLKQQYKFARDTMFLYLRNPYFKKIKTYHEDKNKFVIFYTGLVILNIFGVLFYSKLIYLFPPLLMILLLLDFNLLNYVYKREGRLFLIKSSIVALARNVAWTFGMIMGVFKLGVFKFFA